MGEENTFISKMMSLFSFSKKQERPEKMNLRISNEEAVKLVVVGGPKVGKSCFVRRYVDKCFTARYVRTIGCDLRMSSDQFPTTLLDFPVRVQFLDVSHIEIHGRHLYRFLQGAMGILYIFDCSNPNTIDWVEQWSKVISENCPQVDSLPKFLIGHKSDKASALQPRDIHHYAKRCGYSFCCLTSAVKGSSVNTAVNRIMEAVLPDLFSLRKEEERMAYDSYIPSPSLTPSPSLRKIYTKTKKRSNSQSGPLSSISPSSMSENTDTENLSESSSSLSRESSWTSNSSLSAAEEKKFEELNKCVESFYSNLEQDLQKVSTGVDRGRKMDMRILEKQRSQEEQRFQKRLQELKSMMTRFGESSFQMNGKIVTVEYLHSLLVENVNKWRKLLHNLGIEILLKGDEKGSGGLYSDQNGRKNHEKEKNDGDEKKRQEESPMMLIETSPRDDESYYQENNYNFSPHQRQKGKAMFFQKGANAVINTTQGKKGKRSSTTKKKRMGYAFRSRK